MLESFGSYKLASTSHSETVQMVKYKSDTEQILTVQTNASKGIDLINEHLENDKPIIVGTDWKLGHTGNNDKTTDHWVIIVGREVNSDGNITFHYFDPQTSHNNIGTSKENSFKIQTDGSLKDDYRGRTYFVTMVRPSLPK